MSEVKAASDDFVRGYRNGYRNALLDALEAVDANGRAAAAIRALVEEWNQS